MQIEDFFLEMIRAKSEYVRGVSSHLLGEKPGIKSRLLRRAYTKGVMQNVSVAFF